MADFTLPEGDPEALRDSAHRALSLANLLGGARRTAVAGATATVISGLPTRRVADFAGARDSCVKTLDTVALSLSSIGGALTTYAEALARARDEIRRAERDWEHAHTLWLRAQSDCDTELQQEYQREMSRHETLAELARQDFRDRTSTAASVLAGEAHVWVPQGAASPVDAWVAANHRLVPMRLWLRQGQLEKAYRRLELPKEAVANTVKLGLKGWQSWNLLTWIRSASIAASAEMEYVQSLNAYQLIKNSNPDLTNSATNKAYLKAEDRALEAFRNRWPAEAIRAQKEYGFLRGLVGGSTAVERLKVLYPGLTEGEIVGPAGRFARLMGPIRAASPWVSRVLAPVSIATGGVGIWSAATDDSLASDDRWARGVGGAGSIAAGAGTVLVMAGLVSNPVGWGIIIAGSTVAAGAWVYENREAVWDGIQWTGGKVEDGADWAGDKLSDAGSTVKDGVGKAWHGVFG